MRVAVIADGHGNRLTLAAILESVAASAPDLLIELGGAASGPFWPVETHEMLAASGAIALRGSRGGWMANRPPGTLGAVADAMPFSHVMQAGRPHARCWSGVAATGVSISVQSIMTGPLPRPRRRATAGTIGRAHSPLEF